MGERYDVTVTAGDGVFPLVAAAEGKNALARALLSTSTGSAPEAGFRPPELNGRVGTVDIFTAAPEVLLSPDKTEALEARLAGTMMHYDWTINGRPFDHTVPLTIHQGQRATLTFINVHHDVAPNALARPHLPGPPPDGSPGPRKDTAIVKPEQTVAVKLIADNPGTWMLHCHNGYHMDAGMMTSLNYVG